MADRPDLTVQQAEEDARLADQDARRVRAEAERQAFVASETAKRRATEEARQARDEARARADEIVDTAIRTFGGTGPDIAAMVARVREEADAKARSEVAEAELRAARRARRAREEAHARARAEAAEADRRAREAATRASALIAKTPVAGTVNDATATGQLPVVPAAAIAPTTSTEMELTKSPGQLVEAVRPVLPSPPQWRPPPPEAPVVPPPVNPGDNVCRHCGTGSDPSRRFCRKCGESLVPVPEAPRVAWYRRLRAWVKSKAGGRPRESAEGSAQGRPRGTAGPGVSFPNLKRGVLAVVGVVALVAVLGPYRKQVGSQITSVRQRIVPKPSYIDGERAITGPQNVAVPALTDKVLGADEFTSDQVSTDAPGPGHPPVFAVQLGNDSNLSRPVNVFKVGIIAGVLGEQPATHPAPHHVLMAAFGKDGRQEKVKTVDLHDNTSFQSYLFAVKHVSRVDFYVLDTYGGPGRQGKYAIDQVEFFALT